MTLRTTFIITGVGRARRIRTPDGAVDAWLTDCLSVCLSVWPWMHSCWRSHVLQQRSKLLSIMVTLGLNVSAYCWVLFGVLRCWLGVCHCVHVFFSCFYFIFFCAGLYCLLRLREPCNRCHAIKLKLNAKPAKEKHCRANHDTTELKHLVMCQLESMSVCDLPYWDSSLNFTRHWLYRYN